jgi:glycosyltransferase involved in cell wall biosynthesis
MKSIVFLMTSDLNFDQRMIRSIGSISPYANTKVVHRGAGNIRINTFFKKGILFYIEFNLRLFIHLMTNKYDIVYSVDTDTLLAAGFASYFKKFRLVYDSHEYFTGVPELEGSLVKKFLWKTCERLFIKRAQLCITVSDSLAEILGNEFGKQFHTIKNVPYKSKIEVAPNRAEKPYFIYQGAINEGRGIEELLDIMHLYKGYDLYIAGNGDLFYKIEERIKSQKLENIKLLGKLDPVELAKYTQSATIGFNLLSKRSQSYFFSAANKCYDYINSLVPSVNMYFPEYVALMEKFKVGVTVMNLDPKSLTFAIDQLLDENIRRECIEQCKLARQIYNWEVEENKLINLLKDNGIL